MKQQNSNIENFPNSLTLVPHGTSGFEFHFSMPGGEKWKIKKRQIKLRKSLQKRKN